MEGSSIMIQNNNFSETYHSERQTREHILVCLSSAPSNLRIVQTGARMSEAFHGTLTALYVQTPDHSAMSEEDQSRLKEHMRLAEQLPSKPYTVTMFPTRSRNFRASTILQKLSLAAAISGGGIYGASRP